MYDLIVVGAGPAGSMAATYAAQNGVKTALLERKRIVGVPVRCGEAVGVKGTSLSLELASHWKLAKVNRMEMISPSGHSVSFPFGPKDESYIINREIMDRELAENAEKSGAELLLESNVIDVFEEEGIYKVKLSDGRELASKIVILAEGIESRLARKLGWESGLAMDNVESCAFCRVEHKNIVDDKIELHTGHNIAPGGFLWVFPRGNGSANVGLGVLGTYSEPGKASNLLHKFIDEKYPDAVVTNEHCAGVPVGKWRKPLVKKGVMLVGDTALQVNPLNGGGIAYAMYAGKVAGKTVAKSFKGGKLLHNRLKLYEKEWNSYCGKQQMRQYAMKTLLLEKNNDKFLDRIALSFQNENMDKLNYLKIFMRTFSAHPLMLIKTFFVFKY